MRLLAFHVTVGLRSGGQPAWLHDSDTAKWTRLYLEEKGQMMPLEDGQRLETEALRAKKQYELALDRWLAHRSEYRSDLELAQDASIETDVSMLALTEEYARLVIRYGLVRLGLDGGELPYRYRQTARKLVGNALGAANEAFSAVAVSSGQGDVKVRHGYHADVAVALLDQFYREREASVSEDTDNEGGAAN